MHFGNLVTEQRFVLRHAADIDRSGVEPNMVYAVLAGVAQIAEGEWEPLRGVGDNAGAFWSEAGVRMENLISQQPDVAEVAVVGIPDPRWGERPLAIVVADPVSTVPITRELIAAHLAPFCERGAISKWAVPEVMQVERLDRTGVGKLDKKALCARFADL